jgi:hypothetical protein
MESPFQIISRNTGKKAICFKLLRYYDSVRRPEFDPWSDQVGFVVDKVALEQVFSEYFGFPCQSSFHHLLHNHPHLSSGAVTIGQKWPQYKGLSPTPLGIQIWHLNAYYHR